MARRVLRSTGMNSATRFAPALEAARSPRGPLLAQLVVISYVVLFGAAASMIVAAIAVLVALARILMR
jgi:hypothetical protein